MAMSLDRPAIDTNDGTDAENKERCEGCGEGTMVSLIIVASQVEVCMLAATAPLRAFFVARHAFRLESRGSYVCVICLCDCVWGGSMRVCVCVCGTGRLVWVFLAVSDSF